MKLFEIRIREYIGEKEWTNTLLVLAKTLHSAEKKAHKYARSFWSTYEDGAPVRKNKDGQYEFNDGEILVEVLDVKETSKEQFLQEAFDRALINPK